MRVDVQASLFAFLLCLSSLALDVSTARAADVAESLRAVQSSAEYVELVPGPRLALDLRYASRRNFLEQDLYGVFNRAFLHRIAAEKFARAAELLASRHPGYKLLVFDALRPRSVQVLLWNKVKGTQQQNYVANPTRGSLHNYGFAVDLSLMDAQGREVDMGTPFDAFTPMAEPRVEAQMLREGKLTETQVGNRKILREAMEEMGFRQLPIEWWHFDALPADRVRSAYAIVE